MQKSGHIGQRLLAAYADMPRGERRRADLLLEDVEIVRHSTAGELAERAGVSKATAARLFARLGYPGYRAAQRDAREGRALAQAVEAETEAFSAPLNLSDHLDREVKQLVRTLQLVRSDEVDEAARHLRDGDKLWIAGFGEDYALVHFARSQLIRLRTEIRVIPIAGFPIPDEFASIAADDTVLALQVGRRTNMLRNIIGSAARAGAKVVLITNSVSAGDKSMADVILRGRSTAGGQSGSMTTTVSLLTYLFGRLAARIGADANRRVRAIEKIDAEWGDGSERIAHEPSQK